MWYKKDWPGTVILTKLRTAIHQGCISYPYEHFSDVEQLKSTASSVFFSLKLCAQLELYTLYNISYIVINKCCSISNNAVLKKHHIFNVVLVWKWSLYWSTYFLTSKWSCTGKKTWSSTGAFLYDQCDLLILAEVDWS